MKQKRAYSGNCQTTRFRLVRLLVCLATASVLAACAGHVPPDSQIRAEVDAVASPEIVVLVDTEDAASNLQQKARRRGYDLVSRHRLSALDTQMLTFRPPSGVTGPRAIAELESIEPRATAGVNHRYTLQGDPDSVERSRPITPAPKEYADELINWPSKGCRAPVRIGVMDAFHPERLPSSDAQFLRHNFAPSLPQGSVATHGEAILNLLNDEKRLSDLQLALANVIDRDGGASVDAMVIAFNWLVELDTEIISISLAGPYNKILDRAVRRVIAAGTQIVSAVGNDGPAASPRFPAALPGVIAVTAVDRDGNVYENAVRGGHVDIAAPGVDVAVRKSDGSWRYVSGTSIATPFVAAALAAKMAAREDGTEARQVLSQLKDAAADLGPVGHDHVYGYGLLKVDHRCE